MAKLWTVPAAVLVLSTPAWGQDGPDHEGLYLGIGIGEFSGEIDSIDDVDDVDLDFDDSDAERVFVGYRFNRFVGMQLDYTDFGEAAAAFDPLDISADTKGISASVVGTLPLGPIELFARGGLMRYDVEVTSGDNQLLDDNGTDPVYGAGVGVTLFKRWNLLAEYEVMDIEGFDDSHAVWLRTSWRF